MATAAPQSPFDVKLNVLANTGDIMLQWNCSDIDMVDEFIVFMIPPFEAGSVLTTSNTFIHLPVLYNQDYIVRVVASHCAWNSTPAEISFRIGMSICFILFLM